MTSPTNIRLSADIFDVVVIGAGVVGCAIARRFTLEGARVAVIEKASDILDGASKANSAILHTGFDAPENSIELDCIRKGHAEYLDIYREMGLPLDRSGAYVVAWSDEECDRLDDILTQAHENGVTDARRIGAAELQRNEPQLSTQALAAVAVPGESLIDPWSAPYAYLGQALKNGAEIFLSAEITGGTFDSGIWQLETSRGGVSCRTVINCAGLYGDLVDERLIGRSKFTIKPRKGQFAVFDKAASELINAVILPVPTEITKGIVLCRTIFGNLLVGPTAEEQDSRAIAATDEETLQMLLGAAAEKIPALAQMPVTAIYAGLRPATEQKNYRIDVQNNQNLITVGGIRSTGLSAALGIARYVFSLYQQQGASHQEITDPDLPDMGMLADRCLRDWQQPDHGEIVCHCELVTKREIEKALNGPLAARSLAGLKRQTRVTMGRCQGFYCLARLSELTDGYFEQSLTVDPQS